MRKRLICGLVAATTLGLGIHTWAVGVDLGTVAPPGTLGGYTMTAFGTDASSEGTMINSLASPLGGSLGFSISVSHDIVGSDWGTWSHSFAGDVYDTGAGNNTLTLTLPANTVAFYFYAEPNEWFDANSNPAKWSITATAGIDVVTANPVYANSGANGFGFYTSSGFLSTIEITTTDQEFAIGEFGIALESTGPSVPEAGSTLVFAILSLLSLSSLGLRLRRHQ